MGHRFRNWAGTHGCVAAARHLPRSEEEVAEIVRRAAREGATVKVVGAGHSWNDSACTSGHLLSLDRLAKIVAVDHTRRRVTVEAGIRLRSLIDQLDAHGLALSNLGSVTQQSIAGATSTGTHGSGARFGNLASQIVALRLVTGTGEVLELSPERDGARYLAERVGLGALGVVTQVTLQVEEAFHLEERSLRMPFSRAVDEMQALVDGSEHVKLWWLPHTDFVQVYCADRTRKPRSKNRLGHWLEQSLLLRGVFRTILWSGGRARRAVPSLNRLVARSYFTKHTWVYRSDRIFNTPMPPLHREMEYAIPRERAPEALVAMRELIDKEDLRVNFLQEVRFVAGDDAYLSPAHGRATCQLGAYCYYGDDCDRYFGGFERKMLEMDGRPHWGKEFSVAGDVIAPRYPKWSEFVAIRDRLDPDRVFQNDFTRRLFK